MPTQRTHDRLPFPSAATGGAIRTAGPGVSLQVSSGSATLQASSIPGLETSWQTLGSVSSGGMLQVNTLLEFVRVVASSALDAYLTTGPALPVAGTGGGGGGGTADSTAANQTAQIALETAIRDRQPATAPQQGSGAVTASTLRVTLANDGPEVTNSTAIRAATEAVRDRLPSALQGGRLAAETLGAVGQAYQLAAGATSTPQALTTTCRRVSIYARNAAIRYAIGTGTPTASATSGTSGSHYIEQGERLDLAVPASATIAAIRAGTSDGVLEITELG